MKLSKHSAKVQAYLQQFDEGFEVVEMAGGLAGEPLIEDGDLIGIIARPLTVLT